MKFNKKTIIVAETIGGTNPKSMVMTTGDTCDILAHTAVAYGEMPGSR